MRLLAIFLLTLISGLAVASQVGGNLERFSSGDLNNGEVDLYISDDQSQLYSVHFYKNVYDGYWSMCSPPKTELLNISGVKFFWRSEIESFKISFGEFGEEVFYVANMVDLPESRKWILSTLIKKGKKLKITTRGCGSSATTYLISIER